MSKRYTYTKIKKNKFGEQVYSSTLYPRIKRSDTDLYIRAVDGDRLDNLAFKYYKNAGLWWIIAQANHIGKGTLKIKAGLQLRIPTDLSEILTELEDLNK